MESKIPEHDYVVVKSETEARQAILRMYFPNAKPEFLDTPAAQGVIERMMASLHRYKIILREPEPESETIPPAKAEPKDDWRCPF